MFAEWTKTGKDECLLTVLKTNKGECLLSLLKLEKMNVY